MFELSSQFNRFYESCPVNSAETPELKRSRTALCAVTADVIHMGLGLLGMETLERLWRGVVLFHPVTLLKSRAVHGTTLRVKMGEKETAIFYFFVRAVQ